MTSLGLVLIAVLALAGAVGLVGAGVLMYLGTLSFGRAYMPDTSMSRLMVQLAMMGGAVAAIVLFFHTLGTHV